MANEVIAASVLEQNTDALKDVAEASITMSDALAEQAKAVASLAESIKNKAAPQQDTIKDGKAAQAALSSEQLLKQMQGDMHKMLGIVASEYALQKSAEDRRSRAAAEGKAKVSKPTQSAESKTMQQALKFDPAKGIGDWLTKNGGILGAGLVKVGGVLRKIGKLPFKILGGVLKFGAKFALGVAEKLGIPGLIKGAVQKVGRMIVRGTINMFGKSAAVALKSAFKGFTEMLGKALVVSAEKILPRLLTSLNIVGDIVTALSFVWKYIRGYLFEWTKNSPLLSKIVHTLDNIIMSVSNFFDHISDLIVGAFTLNPTKIKDSIKAMFGDVLDLAKGIFNGFTDGLSAFGTMLGRLGSALMAAVLHPTHPIDAFVDTLAGRPVAPNAATKVVSQAVGAVTKVGKGALSGIVDIGAKAYELAKSGIGAISALFESGKKGGGAISDGKDDPGGISYGSHQLTTDNVGGFLKASGYAKQFAGLKAGTAEFGKKWKAINAADPKFEQAQEAYFMQSYYAPTVANVKKGVGIDLTERSQGLQSLAFSTAVQYGETNRGVQRVFERALKGKDVTKMTDAEIIQAVNDYKINTVGSWFTKVSDKKRANIQQRFRDENKLELALANTKLAKNTTAQKLPTSPNKVETTAPSNAKLAQKPSATAPSMTNIKPKADDKSIEKAQLAALHNISGNTAQAVNNFGLDVLPHSETLLNANLGRGV